MARIRPKKNLGTPDRLLRLGVAIVLFGLAYWKGSWILFSMALFVLYEAVFSWCLFYQILGKSSCRIRE